MDLQELRDANTVRNKEWDASDVLDASFFGLELGGECGEALNKIKKLERERLGVRGSRSTVAELAEELADVIICCDLVAAKYGIDLSAAVIAKFNLTSVNNQLKTMMDAPPKPVESIPCSRCPFPESCSKENHCDLTFNGYR